MIAQNPKVNTIDKTHKKSHETTQRKMLQEPMAPAADLVERPTPHGIFSTAKASTTRAIKHAPAVTTISFRWYRRCRRPSFLITRARQQTTAATMTRIMSPTTKPKATETLNISTPPLTKYQTQRTRTPQQKLRHSPFFLPVPYDQYGGYNPRKSPVHHS